LASGPCLDISYPLFDPKLTRPAPNAGKVVQDGAPGWLMRREGPYRDLLRGQTISGKEAS
jgi:hypothetical protein